MEQLFDVAQAFWRILSSQELAGQVLRPIIILLAAWALTQIVKRMLPRFVWQGLREGLELSERRAQTLQTLLYGAIRGTIYLIAAIVILAMYIPAETILTVLGLFSLAFGWGARPLISDYIAGVTLIFEDQFSVGDKVEIAETMGVVENVNLRTTRIRSDTGELFIVPNGDVRRIRNFSRGTFSIADVKVRVASRDLGKALQALNAVGERAVSELDDVQEPPQILSETGEMGVGTSLTLKTNADFAHGADLRPALLQMVREEFENRGVEMVE